MRSRWMVSVTAVAMAAAGLAAALAAAPAAAAPVLPSQDPFYSYSGSLANVAPGTVLRSRSVTVAESGNATPVTATQVLYRTTGQLGQPTVTVATVIRPAVTAAPVRIVSYQTAYDALGSECDPSYTLRGGNSGYSTAQDEEQIILGYVSAGDTVVVSDYEGEKLDWGAGQESGYGTLDGIRAAEHLLGVPAKTTPVGMVGYSGGSIATDMAGELARTYAPELDLVGSAEGGIPVDYFHNLTYINGSTGWAGVIPAVLVSLSRAYDISFEPYLSPYGLQVTSQVANECINSFAGNYPGLTIQRLLKPQYQDYTRIHDLVAIGDHMIMSRTGTPRGPLFMGVGDSDGTGDGIMVTADDEALA
ncbi:MAG TPA: lipase family protein, partial [Solirubrobacteraceae bacterium]|nr:lipase family protein [Solirubrobacteraceae bacterium]